MTAADTISSDPRRADFERWRRRSRLIRVLRLALPATIALIFAGLIGSVAWSTFNAQPKSARVGDEPIRLLNPRFVGRDDKGRAFVLTAESAIRDPKDYQRVLLQKPKNAFATAASVFDAKTGEVVGSGPIQGAGGLGEISAESYGVYGKGDRMVFKGGVRTRLEQKK